MKCNGCEVCGKYVDIRKLINNKHACKDCYESLDKLRSDKRIIKLMTETLTLDDEDNHELNDFEKLESEAISSALYLKNFEILGVSANATLDEIRDRCKEILKTWHPELHKDNTENYNAALKKVAELKKAYETIVSELEKPYKILELKYGAHQKKIMQAYEYLNIIYNPHNFYDDKQLQEKVRRKRKEIGLAFDHLMRDKVNLLNNDAAFPCNTKIVEEQSVSAQSNVKAQSDLLYDQRNTFTFERITPTETSNTVSRHPLTEKTLPNTKSIKTKYSNDNAHTTVSDTVVCLDCKNSYPFDDEICPHCGLFNSQKYKVKNKPDKPSLVPFLWVSEKDGYMSMRCPKCSKISRIKNQYTTITDSGFVTDEIGTCSCGQTFNEIKKDQKISEKSYTDTNYSKSSEENTKYRKPGYAKEKANRAAKWTASTVTIIFFFKLIFGGASEEIFAAFALCIVVFTGIAWLIALLSASLERK